MVQTAPDIFIFWNFVQLHSFLYEIKVKIFFFMLVIALYENWDVSSLAACILVILGFCITYLSRLCTRINDINESLCPFFLTLSL